MDEEKIKMTIEKNKNNPCKRKMSSIQLANLNMIKKGEARNPTGKNGFFTGFRSEVQKQLDEGDTDRSELTRTLIKLAKNGNLKALEMVRLWAKSPEDKDQNNLELSGTIAARQEIPIEEMPKELQIEFLKSKLKELDD